MSRKRARFDVVSIEVTVHCPHCDALVRPPLAGAHRFSWNADEIRSVTLVWDPNCKRNFQLDRVLRELLAPSTEPVSPDRRVSDVAQVQIVCANCSGDDTKPTLTLLTTDGRCSNCGSANYELAAKLQPETLNQNGKELER